jgi:hypothetical protein
VSRKGCGGGNVCMERRAGQNKDALKEIAVQRFKKERTAGAVTGVIPLCSARSPKRREKNVGDESGQRRWWWRWWRGRGRRTELLWTAALARRNMGSRQQRTHLSFAPYATGASKAHALQQKQQASAVSKAVRFSTTISCQPLKNCKACTATARPSLKP